MDGGKLMTKIVKAYADMTDAERREHLTDKHHFGLLPGDPLDGADEDHDFDPDEVEPPDHQHEESGRA
jgi:hypothetical protein